jgi:GDPmannose 4,6-dehydratase
MWIMLQQDHPDDFVIATGKAYSVRHFVELAAVHAGFDLFWEGEGVHEIGIDRKTGKTIVQVDPRYFRPAEVDLLIGDGSKARNELGWAPQVGIEELVEIMMRHDLQDAQKRAQHG